MFLTSSLGGGGGAGGPLLLGSGCGGGPGGGGGGPFLSGSGGGGTEACGDEVLGKSFKLYATVDFLEGLSIVFSFPLDLRLLALESGVASLSDADPGLLLFVSESGRASLSEVSGMLKEMFRKSSLLPSSSSGTLSRFIFSSS